MKMEIGKNIAFLRKKKGMTQEQLANKVGVSAPAVSKWESDNSYPDITLLCLLARALDTDINQLLGYEKCLPEIKLKEISDQLHNDIYTGRGEQAETELQSLLEQYPSDVALKFLGIELLCALLAMQTLGEECKTESRKNLKKQLAEEIYECHHPEYHNAALSILVSIALEEDELNRAEELIQEAEQVKGMPVDFTMQKVSLLLKKGERANALELLQKQQKKQVLQLLNTMMGFLREDMECDKEIIMKTCEAMQSMESMFELGDTNYGFLYAESFIRVGAYAEAIQNLEKQIEQAEGYMRPLIYQAMLQDSCFEPIRDEEAFKNLLSKVSKE